MKELNNEQLMKINGGLSFWKKLKLAISVIF